MGYSKFEFQKLRNKLRSSLIDKDGQPLSCQLHNHKGATGRSALISSTNEEIASHVAEACNIADVIQSVDRLLRLPRSEKACSELSEIILLRLDILREYIKSASQYSNSHAYVESISDTTIRRWAGFLKHPSDYVFAHRCLSAWAVALNKSPVKIDNNFLAQWDKLKSREKDKKKSDLANEIVTVILPPICDIESFFDSCKEHIINLLN